ncbi:MAG: ferredoxin family protein [Planctomycetes bacterium]|nr:ferredoxin family protein [Planctomycetota bacterium]
MASQKLTVVISQCRGKHPARRQLEADLVAAWMADPRLEVSLIPHLYDMTSDHSGMMFLRSVRNDLVILAWLYPRATRWILDRNGVKGTAGRTELVVGEEPMEALSDEESPHGIGALDPIDRRIYCLRLDETVGAERYLDEVARIAQEVALRTSPSGPSSLPIAERSGAVDRNAVNGPIECVGSVSVSGEDQPVRLRWYPVIDYDRCTNCMECIDFCLFGVYGIDQHGRIIVELPDNCKRGCPACSRVCPENAILFPAHKTPAIAGAAGELAGLRIDLSELFGGATALQRAVQERDAALRQTGRPPVADRPTVPRRPTVPDARSLDANSGGARAQEEPSRDSEPQDELDELIDSLDGLEL